MRHVRHVLVAFGVLAGVAACMNDFEKFEDVGGQGSDPLAEQDAAPSSDAGASVKDASVEDAVSTDAGDDACATAPACEATMATCRSACEDAEETCLGKCNNNGFCRLECRQTRDRCSRDCRDACRSCASGCRSACD